MGRGGHHFSGHHYHRHSSSGESLPLSVTIISRNYVKYNELGMQKVNE